MNIPEVKDKNINAAEKGETLMDEEKKETIPLGLGMALAGNHEAFKAFAALSIPQQQDFIENAHTVRTSREMMEYVSTLTKKGGPK